MTDYMKKTIKAYLDKRAEEDELFAVRYANPKKNIDECVKFIMSTVAILARDNQCYGMHDDEVYSLALHYYDEDDIEIGKLPENCTVVVNHTIQLTDEEKAKARENAMQEVQREAYAEIKRRADKKAKRTTTTQSQLPIPKEVQQNLF